MDNELEHNCHMLPILIYYEVIRHNPHVDILKDNSTYDYSYTYHIVSHLSISGD